jgi:hypothetical protein
MLPLLEENLIEVVSTSRTLIGIGQSRRRFGGAFRETAISERRCADCPDSVRSTSENCDAGGTSVETKGVRRARIT